MSTNKTGPYVSNVKQPLGTFIKKIKQLSDTIESLQTLNQTDYLDLYESAKVNQVIEILKHKLNSIG